MGSVTKRQKRKIYSLLFAIVISIASYLLSQQPAPADVLGTSNPGLYRVLKVYDGDTIEVDMNGNPEKIRFIGVDTPETQDPRKSVQCFGKAASDFSKQNLTNQSVRLESDPQSSNRDRYNRLLRYVYLPDGRLWQAELIRQGYGFAYTNFPFTKSVEFEQYEAEARAANRGLWGGCQVEDTGKSRNTNDAL